MGKGNDDLPWACFQRVRSWFKNHTRPSAAQGPGRRGVFCFKREARRLSDVQRFSKLYYAPLYRKAVTQKWRETYRIHYERAMNDESEANKRMDAVDAAIFIKGVHDSMREALKAGLLDTTITESPDDPEGDNARETQEDEGGEDEEGYPEDDPMAGEIQDGFRVPKVAVWYRNAVMRELWMKASPSQRDAVEEHKKREADGEETDDSDDDIGDDKKRAKRLQDIIRFVRLSGEFMSSHP